MQLSFIYPLFGVLLLFLPALWFGRLRPGTVIHGFIRTVLFVLVILALMRPVLLTSLTKEHHAVIVDQSSSLSVESKSKGRDVAKTLLDTFSDKGKVTLIQFGDSGDDPVTSESISMEESKNGTSPISDSLELAAQSIPYGASGSVTLITDGLSTDLDWGMAVDQLNVRKIPVHTYKVASAKFGPFLGDINIPAVRIGEDARITVEVIGAGSGFGLELVKDGDVIAQSQTFDSDGRASVPISFSFDQPGFHDVTVQLTGAQTESRVRTIIPVQNPVKVLYLGERQIGAQDQLQLMLGNAFKISSAPFADLHAAFNFSNYDVVIMDDLPARHLSDAARQNLKSAVVNDGLGLFHSGGEAAFGDGGYGLTDIGDMLPVEIYGNEDKSDPSVGLALILDTSGSMAGTRIELAKQLGRIAVRRMQPHDRIGIVEFYGAKHWAIPMQPASNKIEIDRAIGRMKAIGGTVLYPAIQEAYFGLKNVNTRYKHIILITDAGVEDSNYESMLRRIAKDKINVSTILVGQGGHNLVMSDIANWGQGRFYAVGDQFNLVELIFKQPSTKKPPMYKRGDYELIPLSGHSWWSDFAVEALPKLNGFVEVKPRDGAEILIKEKAGEKPVLASWRYGAGRVTALMSEPFGTGTADWNDWSDYGEFLGRLLARTANDNMPFDVRTVRRQSTLSVYAERHDFNDALIPVGYRVTADGIVAGDAESISFIEYAPGLFEAEFKARSDEDIRLLIKSEAVGVQGAFTHSQLVANAAYSNFRKERQIDPLDALDLDALSSLTAGISLSATDRSAWSLRAGRGELSYIVTHLWPFLLLAALALYLADIVYRRWPWRTA